MFRGGMSPIGRFVIRVLLLVSVLAVFTLLCVKSYLYIYHGRVSEQTYFDKREAFVRTSALVRGTQHMTADKPNYRTSNRQNSDGKRSLEVAIVDEHHEGTGIVLSLKISSQSPWRLGCGTSSLGNLVRLISIIKQTTTPVLQSHVQCWYCN